ncbi:Uncharacterised protein [Vibrio cholerae]|nr:Uncharacterised protein [Vibrio cholerae]
MFIQRFHLLVADHFGNNRSGTDLRDTQIAFNHGLRLHWELGNFIAINQYQIRLNAQPCDGALHCDHGGLEDVQLINFLRRTAPHRPS